MVTNKAIKKKITTIEIKIKEKIKARANEAVVKKRIKSRIE